MVMSAVGLEIEKGNGSSINDVKNALQGKISVTIYSHRQMKDGH